MQRLEQVVVALGVVGTHAQRSVLGDGHEDTGVDAIGIQRTGVHEVVGEQGELADPPTRGQQIAPGAPGQPRGPAQRGGQQGRPPQAGHRQRAQAPPGRAPVNAQIGGFAHEALDECGVFKRVVSPAIDHQQHRSAVAIVVAGGQHVPAHIRQPGALLQGRRHAVVVDHACARAQHAAAGLGLQLERRKLDRTALSDKKRRQQRQVVKVAGVHRGVEKNPDRQATGTGDVVKPQAVQVSLAGKAGALLGGIDMKGHLAQTCCCQIDQQGPRGADAIGEQRRPQAQRHDAPHDGQQLIARSQRGLAARDLHIGARAVVGGDQVDAAKHLVERKVLHRLRRIAQVAQRAIEVATLGDFKRHAGHRPAAAGSLVAVPLAGALHARPQIGGGVCQRLAPGGNGVGINQRGHGSRDKPAGCPSRSRSASGGRGF